MSKCKHPGWASIGAVVLDTGHVLVTHRCKTCGAWLPLGPAKDTPKVLVEVRAAELAADWRENVEAFTAWEADGWRGCEPQDAQDDAERMSRTVGYLAHAIAHHDEEQRGADFIAMSQVPPPVTVLATSVLPGHDEEQRQCPYCTGEACRECEIAAEAGNPRDACDAAHDRHYGLREIEPRKEEHAHG